MGKDITFGQIVKERRRNLGLTQAELARRVGCAAITIRRIEANTLRPSVQVAELLALALNIPEAEQLAFVRLARAEPGPSPIPTPAPIPEEIGQEDLSGRAIRGFQLGELIGNGGFGVVYKAVQTAVEREVAVKIILPKYANHPGFIRRFETEAQTVARLEHPYIVPLYDYWREPNAAYLIMRLLRGGSLEDYLKGGPLPLEQVHQFTQQIGQALYIAHRAGIVHRDIKPANILLDEDNNVYLADFGIAKDVVIVNGNQTEIGGMIGSPAYISPEQIRAEPVKPQADIYCLGIMLFELLTGRKPFVGPTPVAYIQQHLQEALPSLLTSSPDLPIPLDQVIQRATAKNPADRYPDILALLDDFQQAIASNRVVLPASDTYLPMLSPEELAALTNPFKGLRPFRESDAADFYGRDTLIQELLSRLADVNDLARFLAVVGPSGSGKSSVVRAGLIPALRRGGLPNSDNWFIVEMMPGTHPFEELEAALLRIAVNPPQSLLGQLRDNKRGLLRAVQRILPADPEVELLLVIDQFEEIFTLVPDEETRAHFLDSLVEAVLDERSRLRVVVTMRADFVDRPLQYVDFGELVRQRAVFVLPLTPDELEQVIVQPIAQLGMAAEPELVNQMVREVGDQPGTLPLLQYTLTELFERREEAVLTRAAYEASGGVLAALGRRADEIFAGLDELGQETTRQLFLRLITLGEGVEDTRRRVLRSELGAIQTAAVLGDQGPPKTAAVLDAYDRYRLLTFDHDPVTREPTVEVAHEALLREWGRLRAWLADSRQDLRLQRLLANETREWQTADHDPSYLLRGSRLTQFEEWLKHSTVALTRYETALLQASLVAREEQQAAERERQLHETALEDRSRTLLRRLVVVFALATIIATGLTLFAFNQRNVAQTELIRAERIGLASQAELALDRGEDAVLPALLALQSLQYGYSPEADAALLTAYGRGFSQQQYVGHESELVFVSFSPDDRYVLTASNDTTLRLWEAQTGEEIHQFTGHSELVTVAAFSPDGKQVLSGSADRTVRLWDTETGQELYRFPEYDSPVWAVAFAPNGQQVFISDESSVGSLWDLETNEIVQTFQGHTDAILWGEFSADGQTLITGSIDRTARLWDVQTGQELRQYTGHAGSVSKARFSPDGRYLLTASFDNTARLWDLATGESLHTLIGHTNMILGADFSPNGQIVATGGEDHVVRFWSIATGEELRRLSGHIGGVASIDFTSDGQSLLTGSVDHTARLWQTEIAHEPRLYIVPFRTIHSTQLLAVAFAQDNKQIITGMGNGNLNYWDIETEQIRAQNEGNLSGFATSLRLSADESRVVITNGEGLIRLRDVPTNQEFFNITGHTGPIWDVQFSPDEQTILTGGEDNLARLWDAQNGMLLHTFAGHTAAVYTVAFTPDGKNVVTAGQDGTARLWDIATETELRLFSSQTGSVRTVAVSPDGRFLLIGGDDAIARLWSVQSGELIRHFVGHSALIWTATFAPDGQTLLTGSEDKTARLWNSETGLTMRQFVGHNTRIRALAFSADGKEVLIGDSDVAHLWRTDLDEVVAEVCAQLPRHFTDEERTLYNISDDRTICQP